MFPKDRFGQFSAAMCAVRSVLAVILGSMLAGAFMKLMEYLHGGDGYYYRYCYVWKMVFQIVELWLYVLLYREWKRLGGRKGYTPPGVEDCAKTT